MSDQPGLLYGYGCSFIASGLKKRKKDGLPLIFHMTENLWERGKPSYEGPAYFLYSANYLR